jgi:hypothetical protein
MASAECSSRTGRVCRRVVVSRGDGFKPSGSLLFNRRMKIGMPSISILGLGPF